VPAALPSCSRCASISVSLPADSASLLVTTSRSRALAARSPPTCARSSSTNAARSGVG